ncbi:MAG: DNA polymerase III subunit delta' [Bacillota bacterium]|nr:DNA polymerase III subunit delta' [Bacillota bacterium]
MSFEDIIGHNNIKTQFVKAIETNTLAHAHLIVGEDGIGKSLLAKNTAVKLLGKSKDIEYADIKEWGISSTRKSISVDQVRDIIEELNKKPYEGDKKITIVHDADKMTVQAQNAFLKTIEEPPRGVTIILLAETLDTILETIKSRCQIHKLRRLNQSEMDAFLEKKYPHMSSDELKAVSAFSDGIPGRAEKFLEDDSFKEVRDNVVRVLTQANADNLTELLKYEGFFTQHKDMWREVLACFLSYIRDVMVYKEIGDEDLIINADKINDIRSLASMFSFNKLNKFIEIINNAIDNLQKNVNLSLTYNVMLMKMQEV